MTKRNVDTERDHTYCLNCGGSFGTHDPDDMESCGEWWPSTLQEDSDG